MLAAFNKLSKHVACDTILHLAGYDGEFLDGLKGSCRRNIVVCGHSVGGAVAQLVMLRLQHMLNVTNSPKAKKARLHCVTFGAPMVASKALAAKVTGNTADSILNIVGNTDPVPLMLSHKCIYSTVDKWRRSMSASAQHALVRALPLTFGCHCFLWLTKWCLLVLGCCCGVSPLLGTLLSWPEACRSYSLAPPSCLMMLRRWAAGEHHWWPGVEGSRCGSQGISCLRSHRPISNSGERPLQYAVVAHSHREWLTSSGLHERKAGPEGAGGTPGVSILITGRGNVHQCAIASTHVAGEPSRCVANARSELVERSTKWWRMG